MKIKKALAIARMAAIINALYKPNKATENSTLFFSCD